MINISYKIMVTRDLICKVDLIVSFFYLSKWWDAHGFASEIGLAHLGATFHCKKACAIGVSQDDRQRPLFKISDFVFPDLASGRYALEMRIANISISIKKMQSAEKCKSTKKKKTCHCTQFGESFSFSAAAYYQKKTLGKVRHFWIRRSTKWAGCTTVVIMTQDL